MKTESNRIEYKRQLTDSLEKEVVDEARENLEVGQSLSPVINKLLKDFNKTKQDG